MNENVIVIGAGHWGKNLVRTFYELGALAGVAEASPALRTELSGKYPDIRLYDDHREALQADVQALVIATPAPTHYPIALEALQAGKDVFIEKPMTLSSAEAEHLVQLADERSRILMVGHLLLYQPAVEELKRLIDAGAIGELKSIHQERLKLGRVRSVENVLWSFGVHDLAVILRLAGRAPEEIQVVGHRIIQNGIEDDVYLHLRFANDLTAHLHTSWLWPELRRRLTVIGTAGMIVFDEERQVLIHHRKGINPDLSNRDEGETIVFQSSEPPLTRECLHFLECVRDRRQPVSDGRNGLEVVRILELASRQLQA